MFVVLVLRKGDIHIINYRQSKGYRTYCSKNFSDSLMSNTFAADNTFPGICKACKDIYDDMYQSDLDQDLQMARNGVQMKYYDLLDFHRYEIEGPKAKYEDTMGKHWNKLFKYQRKTNRQNKFK